jgi:hypothetical protein
MPGLEAVTQWPWAAPAETDFGPVATAWRAAKALSRTDRQKDINAEFRESLAKLGETIDKGTVFLDGFSRTVLWAARILGGAALLGAAGALIRFLVAHFH